MTLCRLIFRSFANDWLRKYSEKQGPVYLISRRSRKENESSEFSVAGFEVERAAVEVVGESDVTSTKFVRHLSPFICRQPSGLHS